MYDKLGAHWAGTLLGLVQIAIIPIPVIFWKYGHRIRMKSALISSMRVDEDRREAKRKRTKTTTLAKGSPSTVTPEDGDVEKALESTERAVNAVGEFGVTGTRKRENEHMEDKEFG